MKKTSLENAISFRYALLDSYKKLGLTEGETMVALMIDHLLEQGNSFITPDLLALRMNYSVEELDAILVELLKNGYLTYESKDDKLRVSIKGLRYAVYKELRRTLAREEKENENEQSKNNLQTLLALFEDKLARPLSPLEKEVVASWLSSGYSNEEIKDALMDVLRENERSLKAVEHQMKKRRRSDDIAKEGVSAIDDNYNEDITKVLEEAAKLFNED